MANYVSISPLLSLGAGLDYKPQNSPDTLTFTMTSTTTSMLVVDSTAQVQIRSINKLFPHPGVRHICL